MLQIGICGSYGGMNLGDEAILESMVRELRRRAPVTIHVLSRDSPDTLARHDIERSIEPRRLCRSELISEIGALDLLILGGGGLLFDGEASLFVRPLRVANALGVPSMTWAIGAGPLRDPLERAAVLQALQGARLVTVRDRCSQMLIEELGVTQDVHVVPDPALLLEAELPSQELLRAEGIAHFSPLVGISIREQGPAAPDLEAQRFHELLANTIDYLVERMDAAVVFVPMERQDRQQAHHVAARVRNAERVHLLKGDYSARQLRGLMTHLEFAVGMRLHFLIFAASGGTASVALPYGSKVAEFAASVAMPTARFENTGQLLACIDRAWVARHDIVRVTTERARSLRARAEAAADWAIALASVGSVQVTAPESLEQGAELAAPSTGTRVEGVA